MTEKAVAAPEGTFYTASEAAKVRGVTYTSILNAKEKLAGAGVDTSGKGKDWKIPASLIDILPLPRAAASRPHTESNDGRDILSIQEEYLAVEEMIAERKTQLTELNGKSKTLKKQLDSLKRNAVKDAEDELAAAQAKVAAIHELVGRGA